MSQENSGAQGKGRQGVTGESLRIAYAIQNVGGIDLARDLGDGVPVKNTLKGLQARGHAASCIMLRGRSVLGYDDVTNLARVWQASEGMAGRRAFRLFESAVRRLQREARLPYFALFDSYRFYAALLRCLPGYQLCHEHQGLFSLGAALACNKLGLPYILTFSADPLLEKRLKGEPLRGLHRRVAEWEMRYAFRQARKVLCVSAAARDHLVTAWQVDPARIVVMPNGVDVALFAGDPDPRPLRVELGLNGAPVVIFVGGFQKWHGLDNLLESFARVIQAIPDARLLLVGDGPARADVERRSAELGLGAAVRITGLVPQHKVPAMIAAADVAALPYPRLPQEMWFSPLKLYEYMASGKAIVASRSGQIAEVIEQGRNGVLVEAGDIGEFAEATIRLLQDPDERRRLGGNARRQAVERHSWDRYVERLEAVYRSALAHGHS